jgi:hypothetical protein
MGVGVGKKVEVRFFKLSVTETVEKGKKGPYIYKWSD